MNNELKIQLLAAHLDSDPEMIHNREDMYSCGTREYLVLEDWEANEEASNAICRDVWAFKSDFLAAHIDIPAEAIDAIKNSMYEDASPVLLKLMGDESDKEHFICDAILSDGRGHFLAQYDGEEIELGQGIFAYRIN